MKNWKVWKLYDKDGNLLIAGRKRDVTMMLYHRFVYQHIFTDALYRTNENLYWFSKKAVPVQKNVQVLWYNKDS